MKILHLATRDTGGSFKACHRLHQALQALNIHSDLLLAYQEYSYPLAQHIHSYQPATKHWWQRPSFSLRYRWSNFKKRRMLRQIAQPYEVFSFPNTIYRLHEHPLVQQADVIHLHWVADFIDYPSFFKHINKPIVWTLHDQNPILGGLHYDLDIQNGRDEYLQNLEKKFQVLKREALGKNEHFHIVATSAKMLEDSQKSGIFSQKTQYSLIPCGLNIDTFKNTPKAEARKKLNIPIDTPLVLFVAESIENKRKGFQHFAQLMQKMNDQPVNYAVVGKGDSIEFPKVRGTLFQYPFVEDETQLANIYAAADLLVVPSLQEAFGYTVIEAFACGTPVVAFDCVGAMDKMRHESALFLAKTGNNNDLVQKIQYLLNNPDILTSWREKVRDIAVQYYTQQQNAKNYLQIYQKALGISEQKNNLQPSNIAAI